MTYVGGIERGRRNVSLVNVVKIALRLKVKSGIVQERSLKHGGSTGGKKLNAIPQGLKPRPSKEILFSKGFDLIHEKLERRASTREKHGSEDRHYMSKETCVRLVTKTLPNTEKLY